jgi:hypothetical protein
VIRRAIVNVAVGGWYPRGQRRLRKTLLDVGFNGEMMFWNDDYPPGCPAHDAMPYVFKACALDIARASGADLVLWCDASTWFLRDPTPVFDRIESDGYYLWRNPCEDMGAYAADSTLDVMGMDREESFSVPSAVSTFFGLDLRSDIGRDALSRFMTAARDGAFTAPWINDPNGESWKPGIRKAFGSADTRVKACRHDQAALSCIAHQMGLALDERSPAELLSYPSTPHTDDVIALAEDDGGASLDAWESTGYLKR